MIDSLVAGAAWLITGAQARWLGSGPTTAQRIYFANHASHLDFVVIWSALPRELRARTRPVAGRDYWDKTWVRRKLARDVFRAVLIDRHRADGPGDGAAHAARVEAARRTVETTAAALGTTDSLILFPEGTRGDGTEVAPFKSGLYFLCQQRPDVELVPVWLDNLSRILPKGEILPVPLLGSVTFGPPLRLDPAEGRDEFLARAREALLRIVPS